MLKRLTVGLVLALGAAAVCYGVISLPDRRPAGRLGDLKIKGPFGFEPNVGQADAGVRFVGRGADFRMALSSREIVLTSLDGFGYVEQWYREEEFRVKLVGALDGDSAGLDPLPGKSRFARHTNIPNYRRVFFPDVYNGIDMTCAGNQKQLEILFVVRNGARPDAIRLEWAGAGRPKIAQDGTLTMRTPLGEFRVLPPVMIDSFDGERRPAPGQFVLAGKRRARFSAP